MSELLVMHRDRFPNRFRSEIDYLAETSRKLAAKREISFYGGEEDLLSPEDLISEGDAVERARRTLELCRRLVAEYRERAGGGG